NVEFCLALTCNFEVAADRKVLLRLALLPVVVIVSGAGPELSRSGIYPRVLIQHELFVGVDAVAVEIRQEQRRVRHAIRKREARSGLAKQQGIQVVLSSRRLD